MNATIVTPITSATHGATHGATVRPRGASLLGLSAALGLTLLLPLAASAQTVDLPLGGGSEKETVKGIKKMIVDEESEILQGLLKTDWLIQNTATKIHKVHIVKRTGADGRYIPLCRSTPYPNMHKGAGTGIFAIEVPGKRSLCSGCADNLSVEQRACLGLS